MKRNIPIILFVVIAVLVGWRFWALYRNAPTRKQHQVLVLVNPVLLKSAPNVLNTYSRVLEMQGVKWKTVTPNQILALPYDVVLRDNRVIILPEDITESISGDVPLWLKNYLVHGGTVLLVFNSGIKNQSGNFLGQSSFSRLIGVNYINYEIYRGRAYSIGAIQFKDPAAAAFFSVPADRLDPELYFTDIRKIRTTCHIARSGLPIPLKGVVEAPPEPPNSPVNIEAYAVTELKERYPALAWRQYGAGAVCYANIPLAKSFWGDDLLLRCVLDTLLHKIARLPRSS